MFCTHDGIQCTGTLNIISYFLVRLFSNIFYVSIDTSITGSVQIPFCKSSITFAYALLAVYNKINTYIVHISIADLFVNLDMFLGDVSR